MRLVVAGSLAAVAVAMTLGAAPAAAQQPAAAPARVAFVNMRRVLAETPGYAQAETTFVKEMSGYRAEYQKLQVSLDSAATDFEQQATLLSATARATRRRDLETRQAALEQRGQELQQRIATRERELLDPIQTRVVSVIERLRAAGGYSIVFDVSTQANNVVTADKSLDLSEQVIAELKKPS
jgi:outer membrane protein